MITHSQEVRRGDGFSFLPPPPLELVIMNLLKSIVKLLVSLNIVFQGTLLRPLLGV